MTGHQPQRFQVPPEQLGGAAGAILVINAVETIAVNAFLEPFVRARVHCRRHLAVEAGIEHRHLGHRAHQPLHDVHPI
jgi:hypothetical protein